MSDSTPSTLVDSTRTCAECGGEPALVKVFFGYWRKECQSCGSTGPFAPRSRRAPRPVEQPTGPDPGLENVFEKSSRQLRMERKASRV